MLDITALIPLVALALVDSLSFGTLLIPVWLLLAPGRLRPARISLYLGTVAATYFAIGIALLLGASAALSAADITQTPAFLLAQLALGIALFAGSFAIDSKAAYRRAAEREAEGTGRLTRWRASAMGGDTARGSLAALVTLALVAVLAEVATMLPYLVAIGIITAQDTTFAVDAALLAAYCCIMIAPAVVLSLVRLVARSALDAPLRRLEAWLSKHARSTTAWIVGVAGFVLAVTAANDLGIAGIFGN